MILNLTDDYRGWLLAAENKYKKGDMKGALENALLAVKYSKNGDTLFTLAKIYSKLEQYDVCIDVCYEITAAKFFANDEEKYEEMIELMCSSLEGLHLYDIALLLKLHSMYSFREEMDPLDSTSWTKTFKEIGDEFERRRKEFEERDENEFYYNTAKDQRDEYNADVVERIRYLEAEEDFEQELLLIDSMYPDGDYYADTAFYAGGLCIRELKDRERAANYFKRVLEVDPKHVGANLALVECGEEYKERVKAFLLDLDVNSSKYLIDAVFACFSLEEYERAVFFAEKLASKDKNNRYYKWFYFLAKWNVDDKKGAWEALKEVYDLVPTYFPYAYLKTLRLPKKMTGRFQRMPLDFHKRLVSKLIKNVSEENLRDEEYLKAATFSLCEAESPAQVDSLIMKIADTESKEGFEFLASTLIRFYLSPEMRGYVLLTLLRSRKLKSVTMFNNGYLVDIKLSAPKHYDYFPSALDDAYEQLFEHFALTGVNGFEKSLNKTMEIAYDNYLNYYRNSLIRDNLTGILLMDVAKRLKINKSEFLFTSAELDYERLDELHSYYSSLLDN